MVREEKRTGHSLIWTNCVRAARCDSWFVALLHGKGCDEMDTGAVVQECWKLPLEAGEPAVA